jgi:hypothetical protein
MRLFWVCVVLCLGFASEILMTINTDITDGKKLWSAPFEQAQPTNFHNNWFRHLNNITIIAATIGEAIMLVLLIEGT